MHKEILHYGWRTLSKSQRLLALRDLELLNALGSAGSLAAAARQLGLNHASAWRRLEAIEAKLGARLFERTRNGYSATPAGDEAIAMAIQVLGRIDEVERRLAGRDIGITGTVRLTTTEAVLAFAAPALKELKDLHAGLVIEIAIANDFYTLTRREADIALRPAQTVPEGLVARRLASISTAIYAAPAYLLDKELGDLFALDWIAHDDSLAHLKVAEWVARHVPTEQIVHRANSIVALRTAAEVGLGIAALPCFYASTAQRLRRISAVIPEAATSLWLITHPDLRRVPRVRCVLDVLAAYVKRHRALLEEAIDGDSAD